MDYYNRRLEGNNEKCNSCINDRHDRAGDICRFRWIIAELYYRNEYGGYGFQVVMDAGIFAGNYRYNTIQGDRQEKTTIIKGCKVEDERIKELEAAAERYQTEANRLAKEAEAREKVKIAKEKKAEAAKRLREVSGGGWGINIGGLQMSRNMKIVVIIIGTLALFALMKVMGC